MRAIWKYEIEIESTFLHHMPRGAWARAVGVQGDAPVMWFEVDPQAELELRRFWLLGTGHALPETFPLEYVGTFQFGRFVGHVYEELQS